jgi:hypothetical protein
MHPGAGSGQGASGPLSTGIADVKTASEQDAVAESGYLSVVAPEVERPTGGGAVLPLINWRRAAK